LSAKLKLSFKALQQGESMADSFINTRSSLKTSAGDATIFRLAALEEQGIASISRLPLTIRILLESVVRSQNGRQISAADVEQLANYNPLQPGAIEVPFMPARVLLQDFTGVPAVVDLAAMRSAMARMGGNPDRINPLIPVDLVVDHSIQVDVFASSLAAKLNSEYEFERNRERYEFLAWGQKAFKNFSVVPPGSGICHQVNLEYLGQVVRQGMLEGGQILYPDSLVGTDSHTPMINGLGIIGWGVGGIEAEAVMLGQPLYMLAPAVVGFELTGEMPPGATATDLVLTITEQLRREGVVGKFVEFFGPGLDSMSIPDRATISNMSPECGSTVGYFPVDHRTLEFLRNTNRDHLVDRVERYSKEQGLFRSTNSPVPDFASLVSLDLATIEPSLAGPSRPQDRIGLKNMKQHWQVLLDKPHNELGFGLTGDNTKQKVQVVLESGAQVQLTHGSVVIAAITSCTNTSNPSVMLAAGLLAGKAAKRGLTRKPWVKTSLAPGSQVVTDYLTRAGLMPGLESVGFHVVGYGCTTCIGNSGPISPPIRTAIEENNLVAASVLSGNRNFEGRISPHVKASFLASPPLVVAYALAGTVNIDLSTDPLGTDSSGKPVFLSDIWPTDAEIAGLQHHAFSADSFKNRYEGIEDSNPAWNEIPVAGEDLYKWDENSTYIQEPPFFINMAQEIAPIAPVTGARVLAKLGDSITTDHISPAGSVPPDGPAGLYLQAQRVKPAEFNSFGSRRGNDRVMTRGTFANIRLRNQLAPGTEGGWTTHQPTNEELSIHEAALRYQADGVPTIILAGTDYGMGSSRDWAAKGTTLLGVQAVIARSYERIHRSNLIGMGVLPLQFMASESHSSLGLTGAETYSISVDDSLQPGDPVAVTATDADGLSKSFSTLCRIDSPVELEYFRNRGILHTVLRKFMTY
jgi:aconitate hydratase